MKTSIPLLLLLMLTSALHAQTVPLPPFLKWSTNNAPSCKNVFIARDSILLAVKNKCLDEGKMINWRPLAGVDAEQLKFNVRAGATVKLTITYKFKPIGGDVFGFYGTFDPLSDNSDIAFSRSLRMQNNAEHFPASDGYTTAVLMVNFSSDSSNPQWNAPMALHGTMNFHFNVTTNTGDETHKGSFAVIKAVKLEVK